MGKILDRFFKLLHRSYYTSTRYILGIETTCDDTGAAVVDEFGNIRGDDLVSQMKVHLLNGGVIPHIAAHMHKENIRKVVSSALLKSGLQQEDITAIAVANRPGLKGSLLVGTEYAKYLAKSLEKSIIPVHHMEAHALTARLTENKVIDCNVIIPAPTSTPFSTFPFSCQCQSDDGGRCSWPLIPLTRE